MQHLSSTLPLPQHRYTLSSPSQNLKWQHAPTWYKVTILIQTKCTQPPPQSIQQNQQLRQQDTILFLLNYQKLDRYYEMLMRMWRNKNSHVLLVEEKTALAVLERESRSRVLSKIKYARMTMKSCSWIHTLEKLFSDLWKTVQEYLSQFFLWWWWSWRLTKCKNNREKGVNAHHGLLCNSQKQCI